MGNNTITAAQPDPNVDSQNDPMVLRMIDWRGCSAVEYVPGRVGSHPSFIGRRISVQGLVDWIEAGRSWEGFAETFRIEPDAVKEAFRYLNNDPPMEIVDLTDCPAVCIGYRGVPVFEDSRFPVESLFHYLKGGKTAQEFSATYGFSYDLVAAVLRHAAVESHWA